MFGRLVSTELNVLHGYLDSHVKPDVLGWDRDNHFPEHVFRKFHAMGWLNAHILPPLASGHVNTQKLLEVAYLLGYYSPGIFTSYIANILGTTAVYQFMAEPLRSQILNIAHQEYGLFGFAMTENHAGIDVESNSTQAVQQDNHYLINGQKDFITGANYARHFLVFAREFTEDGESPGFSVFYLNGDASGLERGEPLKKLGHRESNTASLIFKNVRVPKYQKLITPNGGLDVLATCVSRTKTLISGACVGLMDCALQHVLAHLSRRVKRDKSLLSRHDIRALLALGHANTEAAWALAKKAALEWDTHGIAVLESSCAKLFAANAAVEFASEAIELCGAQAYLEGSPMAKIYRDAKAFEMYEGASTVQLNFVSRAILAGIAPVQEPQAKANGEPRRLIRVA